jgi:HK97 gp10 family phage protein
MTATVKVAGLADLEKALFELGSPSTARRVGQRALMKASEPMVAAIKRFAPKEEGNLEQSIKAQPSSRNRDKDVAQVLIGIDASVQPRTVVPRKSGKGTYIDPGVAGVAVIQEFGDEKMQANPFARPGFEAEAAATIVRVGETLGPEIEASAARLARKRAKAG